MGNIFKKNRKLIWFSIQNKFNVVVDLNDISIIGIDGKEIEILVLCNKKEKKRLPGNFETYIIYGGKCKCCVKSYSDFKKELINDKRFNLDKYEIVYDSQFKFRKLLESVKKKRGSWIISVKKFLFG